jgi:hypothetical protein
MAAQGAELKFYTLNPTLIRGDLRYRLTQFFGFADEPLAIDSGSMGALESSEI